LLYYCVGMVQRDVCVEAAEDEALVGRGIAEKMDLALPVLSAL
jgi:hypothetical protein